MVLSHEIRNQFIGYFRDKCGHTHLPSSGLIPQGSSDTSLLFTNAGMVQFKSYFTGEATPEIKSAVTSQKCLRAGGKHNDLDVIGHSGFHHTFFEMLGNFSFFDYGKAEAISFAWDFITQVLGLPKEKLFVTYLTGDEETARLWQKIAGLPSSKVIAKSEEDNFWAMGDQGPCGPCTEIFYQTDSLDMPELEIWNLVFMQYRNHSDGTRTVLPATAIDTGMGLERITSVMQGKTDNYQTDLFQAIFQAMPESACSNRDPLVAKRVIADHIRSIAFLIAEDLLPGNTGRNYVLRRLIRSAAYHASMFPTSGSLLSKLIPVLVEKMGGFYPELAEKEKQIVRTLEAEESNASKTLDQTNFWRAYRRIVSDLDESDSLANTMPGEVAFKLQDTYGFQLSLIKDLAREAKMAVDEAGFKHCMEEQRQRSKASSKFTTKSLANQYAPLLLDLEATTFIGYHEQQAKQVAIQALFIDQTARSRILPGESGCLVVAQTPFYAESGGQIADQGTISAEGSCFAVTDVQKVAGVFLHFGKLTSDSAPLAVDQLVNLVLDQTKRQAIIANHTATHLLNQALRDQLGSQIRQQGSYVGADHLRFDFNHPQVLTNEQILALENQLEAAIVADLPVTTTSMSLAKAKESGAQAVFNERYGKEVRVVAIGNEEAPVSLEICGGVHVASTAALRCFKIVKARAVAAGIRRIEAVTGKVALDLITSQARLVDQLSEQLQVTSDGLFRTVESLSKENQQLQNELQAARLSHALAAPYISERLAGERKISVKVIAANLSQKLQMAAVKTLLNQGSGVYFCYNDQAADQLDLVVAVSKDLLGKVQATNLWNELADNYQGKGGGGAGIARGTLFIPRSNRKQVFTKLVATILKQVS